MNLFYKNEKGDFVQVGVNSPLPVTMTGSNGGGGNSFIVDDSNPDTELGEDGDSFLNSSTGDLFSKKNGDWVNVGNLKGQDGADGQDGVDGEDGKSAYEVALENGFNGSEQDWLDSLEGADGQDGTDGQDGEDGFPSEAQWNDLVNRVEILEGDEN